MVMKADEKPSKVSVYVKLLSVTVPPRIEGVQFGFGQVCGALLNPLTDCAGTDNCPFFAEVTVAELSAEKFEVCDSTRLPPWLVQSMVAE
jgi:hypothetical protein